MLGKMKAHTKAGDAGQGANFEEKGNVECEKGKVSEKMSVERVARMMKMEEKHQKTPSEATNATLSGGSISAFYGKTFNNKDSDAREKFISDNRFNLFEEFLPTDSNIVDCELRSSVQDNVKTDYDVNFGISHSSQEPTSKLLKPRKAKQSTIEEKAYCRPKPIVRASVIKKETCTKPNRIKKLPAKLAYSKMDTVKPIVDVLLKNGGGTMSNKPSVVINPLNVTLNPSNLTEIVNKTFVNKIAKEDKIVEKLTNGPLVNGTPNSETVGHQVKNLKITMTKVGDGVWEPVLKTNIKKRRYNSWKMGKLQKARKKRKIEQTDHDYTPNYTPPTSRSQFDTRNNNSFMDLTVKSSPSRLRTTPNRLKDCVEVPRSPSKTSPISALVPPLPSPLKISHALDDSLTPTKAPKVTTKSSTKLMKIEAENLIKRIVKVKQHMPDSQTQPLPRVLARKGSEPGQRPRTYKKRATSKVVTTNNSNTEMTDIPVLLDAPKTTPLDLAPLSGDSNHQKQSPSKGVKVQKEKKTQKKTIKTNTNKTLKKEKTSLKEKRSAMQKRAKVNVKVAKLTAKAKAIRLQIKAEKKKGQIAYKSKAKEISKKTTVNGNSLNKSGSVPDCQIEPPAFCEMSNAAHSSPKKMSLISHLKKKNASGEVLKDKAYLTSLILPEHHLNMHSASLSSTIDSSLLCIQSEALPKNRGRPRTSINSRPAKQRSIRFSKNGLRIGRPPKTTDGSMEESSLVGSQIEFLQSTLDNRLSSSDSSTLDKAKALTSPPDCLLLKNRPNAIRNRLPQSTAQMTTDALEPAVRVPIPMSSYAFIPQSSLVANNPKRSSIRQTECAFRYREIAVKKQDNFIQIVLMSSTRVKNGLNCQVMNEISMALSAAKSDPKCSLVVINGTGSVFCSGVDLISLSMDLGQATAEKMSSAIRDFCKALFTFPKPLVAAVNGAAVGLGVTFLPFFDLVYASDKATFYTPYCKLGQIPEGGATFTLPSIMGYARANALLLEGRRITATEACDNGLITQVFWPATFMEEVIPRVQALANRPLQAMESTKALIRYHEQSKLEVTLDTECRVLLQQWSSDECRTAIRDFLTSEEVV